MHLSELELERWQAWKAATETIAGRVRAEVRAATGLSPADLTVLLAIDAHARQGLVRQRTLCDATGWTQSRMSNHISRMEHRELVEREIDLESPELHLRTTDKGRALLERAAPAEARAVREHLLLRLEDDAQASIVALAASLDGR